MTMTDGKVSAGKGFPRPRTVTVVFEELYYDDAFESFKLLRINFPLVCAPNMSAPPILCSLRWYVT
jgi:hypothetical protein